MMKLSSKCDARRVQEIVLAEDFGAQAKISDQDGNFHYFSFIYALPIYSMHILSVPYCILCTQSGCARPMHDFVFEIGLCQNALRVFDRRFKPHATQGGFRQVLFTVNYRWFQTGCKPVIYRPPAYTHQCTIRRPT